MQTTYAQSRIQVEDFRQTSKGDYIAHCYTPGASDKTEPEYLIFNVSRDELQNLVAFNGKVPYDTYELPFIDWLEHQGISDLCTLFTDIINKREGRTMDFVEPSDTTLIDPLVTEILETVGLNLTESETLAVTYLAGKREVKINTEWVTATNGHGAVLNMSHKEHDTNSILMGLLAIGIIPPNAFAEKNETHHGGNVGAFFPRRKEVAA